MDWLPSQVALAELDCGMTLPSKRPVYSGLRQCCSLPYSTISICRQHRAAFRDYTCSKTPFTCLHEVGFFPAKP